MLKKIKTGESYAIDDSTGMLYVWTQGEFDPFAPPGTFPEWYWKVTGYTYESVQTYGWFLGQIWDNNSLQFATEGTAKKMMAAMQSILPAGTVASITLDEIKTGPFTRASIRQIRVAEGDGKQLLINLNAGEMAATVVSNPETWRDKFRAVLAQASEKRETELAQ